MKWIDKLKVFLYGFRTLNNEIKISENREFENNRIASELMRNTHSMEKGMSIANPRLGYGHKIQLEMMRRITELQKYSDSVYYREVIHMSLDSLNSYIEYHDARGFTDEVIEQIRCFLKKYDYKNDGSFGGSISLKKEELVFDTNEIENFFNSRHSVREFDDSDVLDEDIFKALKLAQRAPSACNRQGVRAYVLSKERSRELARSLDGIGGFAESVNRFVLITGKISSYRADESRQFIVSSSIYAAYLSLTLHLYGMGACIVQRPLIWNKEWNTLRDKFRIEEDEQLVLLLAVGNLKEESRVPVSHRVDSDAMFKFI